MPEISHQQAAALATMEWLLGDDFDQRRTGRSLTLALGFLRYAVNRQLANSADNQWIRIWDHFPLGADTTRIVLGYIESIAEPLNVHVEVQNHRFRLAYCHSGQTWNAFRDHLYEEYVETDIRPGLTPEQIADREAMGAPLPQIMRPDRRRHGTLRDRIVHHVNEHPGQTATQIAAALKHGNDAVASTLLKEVRDGTLERRPGEGPRGGFTYYPVTPIVGPSVWERVKTNPYSGVDP